ncbi:uncharacterized protein LOC117680090 [Pantherophis guttatus]|uniref:Uncharacterized protein LOC117680090 n=1 Tax=Pantherophis guttatus TaxID=94885 RepID=A0A6P9E5B0_PANGU|nr:uncharacterized protein LOC117680090 [Pantherophis guttatus]
MTHLESSNLDLRGPQGNLSNQEMFPQLLGERTNTAFSMEHPPLSNSSARCEDGARMGTSLHGCPDQRTQIDLFYSASGPDMFALVTSILQEPNESEDMTEWDSQSNSFPPPWTMDLENSSRYSSLFPMNIWDHENQANLIESRNSYEEKLEKASPTEPLSRKLCDLQATGSLPLPCPPCFPPSHEALNPSDPQNKDFTYKDLNQQFDIVPECSNCKKQVDVSRRDCFSSLICPPECYGEDQEGIASGVLGASNTEKSIQLPHSAADGIWYPVILESQLCATRCTYESPQFIYLLTSPFQQLNSIPEGANTELHRNQQQNCPNNPSTSFNNVKSKNSVYPLRDSSNLLSPLPGFQQQNSFYNGDKCLKSRSLNPLRASCAIYKKPNQMNTLPRESSVNSSVVQHFGFQMAPRKCSYLQNYGFSNCKENLKPHNSVGRSRLHLRAPRPERLGEISRNIPPRGWPPCLSANRFAKFRRLDSAPNGNHADQKTRESERRAKMNPAFIGPDWTQLDALRSKKKMGNLFDFLNPAFLHLFPLDTGCSQIPNSPASQPPPFSPSCPSFSVDLQYDNIPHLSHVINRDASPSYYMLPPLIPQDRLITNHVGPSRVLYLRLEDCYKQWRALERERTKMEADLAMSFPRKSFATSSEIPCFRLRANPSQVDRLIWIQFQEQAKVYLLLEKLESLFGVPIHKHTWIILERHLEAIRMTQAKRNNEIFNAVTNWKSRAPRTTNEKDTLALASSVNKLMFSTRKTRTALWCAFQHIVLPRNLTSIPGQNALDLANIPLQTKNRIKGKD